MLLITHLILRLQVVAIKSIFTLICVLSLYTIILVLPNKRVMVLLHGNLWNQRLVSCYIPGSDLQQQIDLFSRNFQSLFLHTDSFLSMKRLLRWISLLLVNISICSQPFWKKCVEVQVCYLQLKKSGRRTILLLSCNSYQYLTVRALYINLVYNTEYLIY